MLSFRNLSEYLQLDQDNDSPRYRLNKDVGRFRLWAENTGAHRNGGRSSLDYRVREASPVREIIIKLLRDLERSLNDGM